MSASFLSIWRSGNLHSFQDAIDTQQADITKLRQHDEEAYADFEPHVFLDSEKAYPKHLAPDNELSAAQLIVAEAGEAFREQFDESRWNNSVHSPLLSLAFYGKKPRDGHLHVFQAWYVSCGGLTSDNQNLLDLQYQRRYSTNVPGQQQPWHGRLSLLHPPSK